MTIKEIIDLYHRDHKTVTEGNAIYSKILPLEEIERNKNIAREMLLGFSKEQLVEYILNGGGNRYFPSDINNV